MEFHPVLPNLKNMPQTASEGDQTDWLPQLPTFHQEEPLINIISDLFLYESFQCLETLLLIWEKISRTGSRSSSYL